MKLQTRLILIALTSLALGILIGYLLFNRPEPFMVDVTMYNGTCWVMP